MDSMGESSKLIKITQFNSSLLINQDKLTQKGYKTSYSSSPQKNFTVKKVNELKSKTVINTQKIIEIELKRRQKYKAYKSTEKKIGDDIAGKEQIQKIIISNKWSPNKESFNYELLMMNSIPQTVAIFRPVQRKPSNQNKSIVGKQLSENILLGKPKDIQPKQFNGKISTSKQKIRPQLKSEIVFKNVESDQMIRKLSTSPRKNYSRHFEEQKKYQENIEKQKRQILEMKRQLNKNYAKPFNPPQKISAFSYIIYEADIKKNKKLRKYSARRYDVQQVMEIKKMFLHSHQVIVSLNSRTAVQMASLTKIMTCMIALDLSKKYNIELSAQKVKIGLFEQNICGTSANIKNGQIYSIQQLLYGLMLPSGNDASLAIAIWGGKILFEKMGKRQSESPIATHNTTQSTRQDRGRIKYKKRQYYERFISQMNLKANQLNMQKTKYSNSHGLSNPQNRSCAFDLAILSEYAMNNEHFRRIVSCKVYQTEITIQLNSVTPRQGPMSAKQSRRSLKKRGSMPTSSEGCLQTQELKDMNEPYEDRFPQQQQGTILDSQQYQTKMVRWQNTHHLVQTKSDLYVGIKTGVTTTAGPCLSSCIQFKGRRFIIIVLNCKNMKYRMKDTQNLRKWLFNKESMRYIEEVGEKPCQEDEKDD